MSGIGAPAGWVFDMDGTLTVPQHDFDGLRARLGLPRGVDILSGIAAAPAHEQDRLHAEVEAWEAEHAERAVASPDAVALLARLGPCRLGVLTRNTRRDALRTLEVCGLAGYFDDADVLGRDSAPAKPDPGGVLTLAARWELDPARLVMVGDWIHDVEAGRQAGARTVWVDRHGTGRFAGSADLCVTSLEQIPVP